MEIDCILDVFKLTYRINILAFSPVSVKKKCKSDNTNTTCNHYLLWFSKKIYYCPNTFFIDAKHILMELWWLCVFVNALRFVIFNITSDRYLYLGLDRVLPE